MNNPIAKFKDPADVKKAGKQIASKVGGTTVAAFFDLNKATLQAVLPKHVSPERMLKIALGALRTTPKLMECTVESLFGAVVQCSQLGLEPNTPMGHVYLIPFEKKKKVGSDWVVDSTNVQIVIGYKGMLDLARRSGQIVSISAHEVCANDDFNYAYGLDEHLHHRPAMNDRGEIIAFYAVAKLKDGGHCFEVMSRLQVEAIRDNSQGYKAALVVAKRYNKDPDTPWSNHFGEMGRKTVTRRLFKWLPMSIEMATAAALDGQAEAGASQGLDDILSGDFSVEDPDTPYGVLEHDSDPPSETINQETGEVLPNNGTSATREYLHINDVANALQSAKTLDELAEAADLIREVKNEIHRNQLAVIYGEREEALK